MQHLNFHIFFEVLQPLEPTDRARFLRHQRLLEVSSVVVRVLQIALVSHRAFRAFCLPC